MEPTQGEPLMRLHCKFGLLSLHHNRLEWKWQKHSSLHTSWIIYRRKKLYDTGPLPTQIMLVWKWLIVIEILTHDTKGLFTAVKGFMSQFCLRNFLLIKSSYLRCVHRTKFYLRVDWKLATFQIKINCIMAHRIMTLCLTPFSILAFLVGVIMLHVTLLSVKVPLM